MTLRFEDIENSYYPDDLEDFDPGMPTTCRCGRTVDLSDMVDAPNGEGAGGTNELVCRKCAAEVEP